MSFDLARLLFPARRLVTSSYRMKGHPIGEREAWIPNDASDSQIERALDHIEVLIVLEDSPIHHRIIRVAKSRRLKVHALALAAPAGKLRVLDFHWSWTNPYTFWAGVIGGCFLTTASHGTDQLVVQRLLSARSESQSRLALFSSWIVIFVQFTLFLTIGMLLWVYQDGRAFGKDELDRLYPSFIWHALPVGIAGLAMAAIIAAAMANLSAALNSLASATVADFYQPLTKARHSAEHRLCLLTA